jgi:hypothetical protein
LVDLKAEMQLKQRIADVVDMTEACKFQRNAEQQVASNVEDPKGRSLPSA